MITLYMHGSNNDFEIHLESNHLVYSVSSIAIYIVVKSDYIHRTLIINLL